MIPDRVTVPSWYLDKTILPLVRYKSFVKYSTNSTKFLVSKILTHLQDVRHPDKERFTRDLSKDVLLEYKKELSPDENMAYLMEYHRLEVMNLVSILREITSEYPSI